MNGLDLFEAIKTGLGPEAHRHRGIDAPARRDTAIAGGSYRAPGALVDGFRAGDPDIEVSGVVVAARASTAVLHRAKELGANIVISRQAFLGDSRDRPVGKPEPALAEKLAFIAESRIAVLRLQDPRVGKVGRAITEALPTALRLSKPTPSLNLADGLVYASQPIALVELVRRIKIALPTPTVRLVGDLGHRIQRIAFATETSRPNALNPLLARPDVEILVAGEVHETETTAYVLDALTLAQSKALLLCGSIAMEEPSARLLAEWLKTLTSASVWYLPTLQGLTEID